MGLEQWGGGGEGMAGCHVRRDDGALGQLEPPGNAYLGHNQVTCAHPLAHALSTHTHTHAMLPCRAPPPTYTHARPLPPLPHLGVHDLLLRAAVHGDLADQRPAHCGTGGQGGEGRGWQGGFADTSPNYTDLAYAVATEPS